MNKLYKMFVIAVANLNAWLGKRSIPKNTPYCYTRYYSKEKLLPSGLSKFTWTRSCPNHNYVPCKDTECYCNEKVEWCHWIGEELSIQDACKDCLISMGYNNDMELELSHIEFICNECNSRYKHRADADFCRKCSKKRVETKSHSK